MTVIFVTFVTYHVTFECFAGQFMYDAKRTLRLMINLKVIFILNLSSECLTIYFLNIQEKSIENSEKKPRRGHKILLKENKEKILEIAHGSGLVAMAPERNRVILGTGSFWTWVLGLRGLKLGRNRVIRAKFLVRVTFFNWNDRARGKDQIAKC